VLFSLTFYAQNNESRKTISRSIDDDILFTIFFLLHPYFKHTLILKKKSTSQKAPTQMNHHFRCSNEAAAAADATIFFSRAQNAA